MDKEGRAWDEIKDDVKIKERLMGAKELINAIDETGFWVFNFFVTFFESPRRDGSMMVGGVADAWLRDVAPWTSRVESDKR